MGGEVAVWAGMGSLRVWERKGVGEGREKGKRNVGKKREGEKVWGGRVVRDEMREKKGRSPEEGKGKGEDRKIVGVTGERKERTEKEGRSAGTR